MKHHALGAACNVDGARHGGDIVIHNDHLSAFGSGGGCAVGHGHTDIGDGEHRGIIHTVTNHHRDGFAGSCSGPDCGYLILREQFGVNLVNADFAGNDIGGSPLVTGKHGELGDAQLMQFGEHCLGVGTRHIAQHDARDKPAVNGHVGRHLIRLQQAKASAQVIFLLSSPS